MAIAIEKITLQFRISINPIENLLLGNEVNPIIPYLLMAGFAAVAGILTLFLPETLNKPLPETIADAVNLSR